MKDEAPFISFPPGCLTEGPLRIPVLWDNAGACALGKPRGIPAFADTRAGGGARSILPEIQKRAKEGAQQFLRLGLVSPSPINLLDRACSGVLLCAKNEEGRARLRNEMGSLRFTFRYRFLAAGEGGEFQCDLPLAIHHQEVRGLVSHQTGKKCWTRFRRIEAIENLGWWESESPYDRFHQVRIHAAECGLEIVGETIYGATPPEGGRPLFLHLAELLFPGPEGEVVVEAPLPGSMETELRRLRNRSARRG
jgi:23S rRNA-/tRNA-specific pseudouridylate synthase